MGNTRFGPQKWGAPYRRLLLTLLWIGLLCLSPQTMSAEEGRAVTATVPHACEDGQQSSGATYRICMPTTWNNDLIVYAHGYVAPNRPIGIPEDQMALPGGLSVDQIATSLGYGFTTSGYRTNGLAIQAGMADLIDVVSIFTAQKGAPNRVLLVGVSEGGAITALALEKHPDIFAGGLAMCGPYGSFQQQITHFGDFRVLFDYFFPQLLPASAVNIPAELLDSWETSYYTNTVQPALLNPANHDNLDQLLATSGAAIDTADSSTQEKTAKDLLWYNVFATNDAKAKLGGQPFANQQTSYAGSADDTQLNQDVARFVADQAAIDAIAADYETSGHLSRPLVTLHTTGDPIVPYAQAVAYRGKTIAADNMALHEFMTVQGYGHCQFSTVDVLLAFNKLVDMVNNPPPYQPVQRIYLPMVAQ
ncbi:MAG: prolyl oligopeptidase family serine peptidase [Caldilineaceae bacterium]